jgi:Glycosyltransferase family 87
MRSPAALPLVLSAAIILNLAMRDGLGSFSPLGFMLTIVSLLLSLIACLCPANVPVPRRTSLILFAALAAFLSTLNLAGTYASYIDNHAMIRAANGFAMAGCALCLAFVAGPATKRLSERAIPWWLAAAVAIGIGIRSSAILACPDPVVDVFAMMRDLTDHLLAGRNPYTHSIVTPYGTQRAAAHSIEEPPDPRPAGYPPHPFLMTAPVRMLNADPRWANVGCDVVAAIALFLVATRRSRPEIGFLAAAAWLFLPMSTMMIESAWYEPMLAAMLGLGLWLAEISGWRRWIGYCFVGLGLTAKQYGIALLPALAWPHRQHWRPMLVGVLAGMLVMLPWFAWSPRDFIDIVLVKHLQRPPQFERALTIAGAWYHLTGNVPPRGLLWGTAAGLIGLIGWRGPRTGAAAAVGLGTALLVFSLFHTQGFFNYFYLVQYLWLLGAVGLVPQTANEAAAGAASS